MAVLPDADRKSVWADVMSDCSGAREPVSVTKADLRAAVNAIDDWLNTNEAELFEAMMQGTLAAPDALLEKLFPVLKKRRSE